MKTNLQTSKSILAKLLASENITVSHQNTKTAYFDLKNRTMVLPVWKDMDGDLYDLLTGHEVGHALNTPEQGWHDAVKNSEDNKKFKDFLNVIEDARIEKLVKRKFPGLSRSFANAYASLYERDFFGIKKLDNLNKLNLIDRINLRFKMGAHVVVEFNDYERDIVREIENAETWDQVHDIARRVYDYVKNNEQDKIQNNDDLQEQMQMQSPEDSGEQESDDFDDIDSDDDYLDDVDGEDGESDLTEDSDGSDADQIENSDESSNDEDSKDAAASVGGDEDQQDDEPHSVTDQNFRRREQELVNETGKIFMYNLPDCNINNLILPNSEVMSDLEKFIRNQVANPQKPYGMNGISYDTVLQKCVRKFNTNNKKVIMHILKEFEMRKKASEYARAQTARTGELNMNVLHKYKFSNDLFRKITVVPKGKNHGFILFVDMSGSMADILRNTIDQMLVLASFCKLAKVPFEVYGFSDDNYTNHRLQAMFQSKNRFLSDHLTETYVGRTSFHLKHLIGSSLSPIQYRRAFNLLCVVANEYYRFYDYHLPNQDNDHGCFDSDWTEGGFGLNGTPFVPTLLASREIITQFQNKNQLDVCNVVYLTDGEGGSDLCFPALATYDEEHDRRKSVIYLVDKKTKKKVKLINQYDIQAGITRLVSDVTGCKHIGFYVGNRKVIQRDMKYSIGNKSFNDQMQAKKTWREGNYFITSRSGYDKYFFVAIPNSNIQDDDLVITKDMTKNKMAREFSKNLGSKRTNRLLLTKLAEELAVA